MVIEIFTVVEYRRVPVFLNFLSRKLVCILWVCMCLCALEGINNCSLEMKCTYNNHLNKFYSFSVS